MVERLLLVAADVFGADGARVPGADVPVVVGQQLPLLLVASLCRQQLLHLRHRAVVHPRQAVGVDRAAVLPLEDYPVVAEMSLAVHHMLQKQLKTTREKGESGREAYL